MLYKIILSCRQENRTEENERQENYSEPSDKRSEKEDFQVIHNIDIFNNIHIAFLYKLFHMLKFKYFSF